MFKNKIEFTKEEQQVIDLLKGADDGIYLNVGDPTHKRLRNAMADLFFKGMLDRGDKAINHYILTQLGRKAVEYNSMVDTFNNK